MKQTITSLLLLLFLTLNLSANTKVVNETTTNTTDANLTGHVVDINTGEHLPFVTIALKGTNTGTATDATGHFILINLPAGEHTFVASMVGFDNSEFTVFLEEGKTKEVEVTLSEASYDVDEVVISSNRYETKKREAVSIVNVISPLLIEKTSSNSMAEVLDFQSGLRVENSCSNCGSSSLRINGLDGQYSQILIDGRPMLSSLAAVYGLEQLPTGMVDRVEVMRGGGSALYGANAIGGVVNIITKEPKSNTLQVSNSTGLIGLKSLETNTNINGSFITPDNKIGMFLFGTLRTREGYDHNDDGFTDVPELAGSTLGFRSYFKTSNYSKITAEYHHISEERRGGDSLNLPVDDANIAEYLKHSINAGSINFSMYTPGNKHFLNVYTSAQHVKRDSYFGTNQDPNAFGHTQDVTVVAGAQYRYSMGQGEWVLPADLTVGAEYTFNDLADLFPKYTDGRRDKYQTTHLGGIYAQNEWKNKQWSINIGGRLEMHNMMKKPVFSPRASVRFTPIEEIVLRASYSSGYRAPQMYDEDLHISAVGGELNLIGMDANLKPEYSHSVNLSFDFKKQWGNWGANLTLDGFFTQLNDVFTLRENGSDVDGNNLWIRTNAKGARVAGINAEGGVGYKKIFDLQLGYTFQRSEYIEPEAWSENTNLTPQKRMFRAPDHYGYFTAQVEPVRDFKITLSGKLTGPMLVQHAATTDTPGLHSSEDREVVTPTFFDMGAKVSYDIPLYRTYTLQINAGVKNMFNAFQKDLDKGANRDAGYVYGPMLPRTIFAGLILNI